MKERRTADAVSASRRWTAQGVNRALRAMWSGFLHAACGYALSLCLLPFGSTPLGLAYLCAANRKVPYIFWGVCLASLQSDKPLMGICAATVAVLVRILVRFTLDPPRFSEREGSAGTFATLIPDTFSESMSLRMATSCLAAFMVGVYDLAAGGFLYYHLFAAILGMLAAPVFVLLLGGIFGKKEKGRVWQAISYGGLLLFALLGAKSLTVYGVSVAVLCGMLITLYVTKTGGITAGMASGLLGGLAYSPALSPSFVLGALAAGALLRVSSFFAYGSAFLVSVVWAFYVGGIGALTGEMPALLAGTLIAGVLDKLFWSEASDAKEKETPAATAESAEAVVCVADDTDMPRLRMEVMGQRVKRLCESFSAMSEIFLGVSERMRYPMLTDLRQICENAFDAGCANCAMKHRCWEECRDRTHVAIHRISAVLHTKGSVEISDVPASLAEHCERISDMVDEINYNGARYRRELLLCDKNEIFAMDYAAVADLLSQTMLREDEENEYRAAESQTLRDALQRRGWAIDHVAVWGKRRVNVSVRGRALSQLHAHREEICRLAQEICSAPLGIAEEKDGILRLSSLAQIEVEYAGKTVSAEEEACGDTLCDFYTEEETYYSFLGDGMGSGIEAAQASGICSVFLEKMLHATSRCEVALQMLNGFLRHKGGGSFHECSATVDLMELDLLGSRATFYKCGAAPTYVLREGSLIKLRSGTVPLGILQEAQIKKIGFEVSVGDTVVMVSDGITGGKEECPWLYDMLQKVSPTEAVEVLADRILKRASMEAYGDDMSVAVIRIRKKEPQA